MNPTSNETTGMQLPPPVMEQQIKSGATEQISGTPEQVPGTAEKTSAMPAQAPPAGALPLPPMPLTTTLSDDNSTASPPASNSASSSSSILNDSDLIEKEWVNKAKQIVALNRQDPYKQSEELTLFRADYMKKHYDKNIKLSK